MRWPPHLRAALVITALLAGCNAPPPPLVLTTSSPEIAAIASPGHDNTLPGSPRSVRYSVIVTNRSTTPRRTTALCTAWRGSIVVGVERSLGLTMLAQGQSYQHLIWFYAPVDEPTRYACDITAEADL